MILSLLLAFGCLAVLRPADAGEPVRRPGAWAHEETGRPADPSVRFGTLPNGMRYALMRNTTPARQMSMWLRIGSGSLQEHDDQRGLAHVLEHLAFRGSTRVPGGDMVQILERKGLELGPDTNAETGKDQTVYKLNFPENDPESLEAGLMLLREIASELTLAPDSLASERGVVLSEERLRDSPAYQAYTAQERFLLAGQRAAERSPIGLREVIQTAPASLVREFYEREYRPDNATLIVVGDMDPDQVARMIEARFADWTPRTSQPAAPDLGTVAPRGRDVALFSRPGISDRVSVTWAQPYDDRADTLARERSDVEDQIAMLILDRRLERLAQLPKPPFVSARGWRSNVSQSAKLTQFDVQPNPGGWADGLRAMILEQRRLAAFGVLQDEIDRQVTIYRTYLANGAAAASTRTTPSLAEGIVHSVNDGDVYTSPAQDVALFDAMVPDLSPDVISAAARRLFQGSGPLVFLASAVPLPGGADTVRQVLADAEAGPLEATSSEASLSWPYHDFGPAGTVVSRTEIADLGVTDVTFANHVRLLVKPTEFSKDKVLVGVRFGTGRLGIPPERAASAWTVGGVAPAFILGGTRELAHEQIQELTASKVTGAQLSLGDDAFQLAGETRPADLGTELELLTAYVTRPGMRPEAFERVRKALSSQIVQSEATPLGVFRRDEDAILHGGDMRWQGVPSAAALASASADEMASILGAAIGDGPLEVTVVGDVVPDSVIAEVARTFGALPARAVRSVPEGATEGVAFPRPGPAPLVRLHGGRADQAVVLQAWPTTDFRSDPQAQRVLGVLGDILKSRLSDRFRSSQGVTYSPFLDVESSDVFRGVGHLEAYIETNPANAAAFFTGLDDIVADLRQHPPSADELDRAKRPRIEQRTIWLQDKRYWLGALMRAHGNPGSLDAIRALVSGTRAVTAEDVQDAARRYLVDSTAFRMIVKPSAPEQSKAEN